GSLSGFRRRERTRYRSRFWFPHGIYEVAETLGTLPSAQFTSVETTSPPYWGPRNLCSSLRVVKPVQSHSIERVYRFSAVGATAPDGAAPEPPSTGAATRKEPILLPVSQRPSR